MDCRDKSEIKVSFNDKTTEDQELAEDQELVEGISETVEEEIEEDPNDYIADWIRYLSKQGKIVYMEELTKELNELNQELLEEQKEQIKEKNEEINVEQTDVQTKELVQLSEVEIDEKIQVLTSQEKYSDLKMIVGKKSSYFYSSSFMATSYVEILVRKEESDVYELIAAAVRRESKIYPRPTQGGLFMLKPYNLTNDELFKTIEEIKTLDEYKDIKILYASNDDLYLYSDMYLSKAVALSLAEWESVEQHESGVH